jgi:hypothetical protein
VVSAFRHPYRTVLGPLGTRSHDGRTLAITGHFTLPALAPIFRWDDPDQLVGAISHIDAWDGWLWATGAVAVQWEAMHLRTGQLVLCADMDITLERTTLDGMDVHRAAVRGALLSPPDRWPWGEVRP